MYGYQCVPLIKSDFPDVPVIDYLHNEDFSWNNGGYPFESTVISRLLDKSYTCTKYLKNLMIEKMNREINNVDPVYIGTDAEHYNPSNTEITNLELAKQFKNKKVVFFPCRVTEQKRPMLMLEILKEIIIKNNKIIFLVVGDGNMKLEVLKRTKKLNLENHIVFLPNQSDMRQFYKMADVTLICSMYEGLTLTTYESLAMGVPVITSDVGGQAELVDETCGRVIKLLQDPKKDVRNFIYSEEEINSYVTAIQEVLNDKQLKQNCRKKILEKFTTEKMVEIFEKEFEYLTKNKSMIDSKLCSNPELANRYLEKCYNTTDVYQVEEELSLDYKNTQCYPLTIKQQIKSILYELKDKMWKYRSWRKFVKFCQTTGITKFKKKLFRLIRRK
jgi:glycosyltransferase involved in cell wall biosynthesis